MLPRHDPKTGERPGLPRSRRPNTSTVLVCRIWLAAIFPTSTPRTLDSMPEMLDAVMTTEAVIALFMLSTFARKRDQISIVRFPCPSCVSPKRFKSAWKASERPRPAAQSFLSNGFSPLRRSSRSGTPSSSKASRMPFTR